MLIVEDERWEREGLAEFLDWPSLGIGCVELACDGIEGLEKAREAVPDILITDIAMPGRNGIELAKLVRGELPNVKIVVLTGYGDFEYARDALRFGAVDYLLKPIEEEALRATISRIVEDCEQEERRRDEEASRRQAYEEGRRAALRQALAARLAAREPHGEAAPDLEEALAEASDGGRLPEAYGIWGVRAPRPAGAIDALFLEEQAGKELRRPVIVHVLGEGMSAEAALLFALRREEAESQRELATKLLRGLDLAGQPADGGGWTIAISPSVKSPADAGESYREAAKALRFTVWNGWAGVAEAADEERERARFSPEAEAFDRRCREQAKRVRSLLGGGDEQGAAAALDELFALVAASPGAGRAYAASLCSGLLEGLLTLAAPAGASSAASGEELAELLACEERRELYARMRTAVGQVAKRLREKREHKDDYLVERLLRLVEARYGDPTLSLVSLAEELFVSPNHLGATFKKKLGKSPTEYLQEYRLALAEEMLRETRQRVAAVAERVGIPNTSYFVALFKNAYGMTPGEYQELTQR
ncbi:response regulator [Cohnella fermenti]|nr:response regulator [Cohnella fermenti]